MPKYLIEVSQPARIATKRVNESVRAIGSHFATHASWRHANGIATGSLVVEVDSRRWALGVVPPNMRSGARIVELVASVAAGGFASPVLDQAVRPYPVAA